MEPATHESTRTLPSRQTRGEKNPQEEPRNKIKLGRTIRLGNEPLKSADEPQLKNRTTEAPAGVQLQRNELRYAISAAPSRYGSVLCGGAGSGGRGGSRRVPQKVNGLGSDCRSLRHRDHGTPRVVPCSFGTLCESITGRELRRRARC